MATMTEPIDATTTEKLPSHEYNAEAHVLSGDLKHPITQVIERNAPASLKGRRGGHITRLIEDVNIEGLVSFAKGQTRVSGSRVFKDPAKGKKDGWVTVSTSIIEGFNIFDILTADRVVSQISTTHSYEGEYDAGVHFPRVTFLGSQFNNIKLSGLELKLTVDLRMCAQLPPNNKSYMQDSTFLESAKKQAENIRNQRGLPKDLQDTYDGKLEYIRQLIADKDKPDLGTYAPITCSLVQSIDPLPNTDVEIYGHILVIPDFGRVSLGEIEVGQIYDESYKKGNVYFHLTGITADLGCVVGGSTQAAYVAANGHTKP